jgi:hypothetical protein
MEGEADAPVLAVLLASVREADESIPAPKGRESWTPAPFPLLTVLFRGAARRGHDRLLGPLAGGVLEGEGEGEGDAPVVAVLVPAVKGLEPMPVPKARENETSGNPGDVARLSLIHRQSLHYRSACVDTPVAPGRGRNRSSNT